MLRTLEDNSGGDIMFVDRFKDFELVFDWRIAKGGNSGVKYLVQEEWITFSLRLPAPRMRMRAKWLRRAVGPEYQIIDDGKYDRPQTRSSKTGALYLLYANDDKKLNAAGLWNTSKIVVRGNHGEHWLNGEKLFDYEFGSEEMLRNAWPRRSSDRRRDSARKGPGYIVLTHHNSARPGTATSRSASSFE